MKDVHVIIRKDLYDYGAFCKNPIGVVDYSPDSITYKFRETGLNIDIAAPHIKDVKPNKLGGKVHKKFVAANHMGRKSDHTPRRNNVPRYWVHMRFKKITTAVRTLTGRQQQILHFKFVERDTNKEIARTLDIDIKTVEKHIAEIYAELTKIYQDSKRTWDFEIMQEVG